MGKFLLVFTFIAIVYSQDTLSELNLDTLRTFYESGKKKSCYTIIAITKQTQASPILHGKKIEWHKNGVKKFEGYYKYGKLVDTSFTWYDDGKTSKKTVHTDTCLYITSYYENGKNYLLQIFMGGKLNGKQTKWYYNGKLESITNYKNGQRDGRYHSWFSDGKKASDGTFRNNKPYNGKFVTFAGDQIVYETVYRNYKLIKHDEYELTTY